ncbi:MAG: glutamate--tRNA ligase [Bacilli bacterium]|nr:glutamate--tRNA ligase [Bacilli bacterium]
MNNYKKLADLIFPEITETIEDLERRYPKRDLPAGAKVTRFAPSPTGFLHTGSLFASMISRKMAKDSNGIFYTRLEDTDQKREVAGSGDSLIDQLNKFGVTPDEGYLGTEKELGNYGPYVQSQRADIYKVVIKYMLENNMAYPCFCSPEELSEMRKVQESKKENFGYYADYAKCSKLSVEEAIERIQNGENFVIRFRSQGDYHNKVAIDDAIRGHIEMAENDQHLVIYKSDGLPTYHFAHLVDDHFMRTTHVTRGEEWMPSLPMHIELFASMNWDAPTYAHLPVIMKLDNGNRRKLSKRKDLEAAVSFFLEQGYPIEGFMEYLYTIANSNYEGWRGENPDLDKDEFKFSFDKMSLDGALFDLAKVQFLCKEKLGRMNTKTFAEESYKWAKEYSSELANLIEKNQPFYQQIVSIEREKENPRKDYEKYSDILPLIKFFYNEYYNEMVKELEFPENYSLENVKEVLNEYVKVFDLELSEEDWFNQMKEIATKCGYATNRKDYKKNPEAYKGQVSDVAAILRLVITLRLQSPNLYYVMKILGKDEVSRRIGLFL